MCVAKWKILRLPSSTLHPPSSFSRFGVWSNGRKYVWSNGRKYVWSNGRKYVCAPMPGIAQGCNTAMGFDPEGGSMRGPTGGRRRGRMAGSTCELRYRMYHRRSLLMGCVIRLVVRLAVQ